MKSFYCAVCGKQILAIQKAVPATGKVYNLIQPHNCIGADKCEFHPILEDDPVCACGSDISGVPFVCTLEYSETCEWAVERRKVRPFKPKEEISTTASDIDKLFDSFEVVQKLNNLVPAMKDVHEENYGDKRSEEHTRKELKTTIAPQGILDTMKGFSGKD